MATNPFFSGKNKHFLQILSLSVIVVGLAAGVILTQQPQLLNPQAAESVCQPWTGKSPKCLCASGLDCVQSSVWGTVRCTQPDSNLVIDCCPLGYILNSGHNSCVPKGSEASTPVPGCSDTNPCNQYSDKTVCCNGVCQEGCGTAPTVNCKNITISGSPTTLTKGTTYTITASYGTLGRNGTERLHVESGSSGCNEITGVISPASYSNAGSKTRTFTWTPNTVGTFTIYCEESASAYGMCFGEGDCKPPTGRSTTCKGPTAKVTVTVK